MKLGVEWNKIEWGGSDYSWDVLKFVKLSSDYSWDVLKFTKRNRSMGGVEIREIRYSKVLGL